MQQNNYWDFIYWTGMGYSWRDLLLAQCSVGWTKWRNNYKDWHWVAHECLRDDKTYVLINNTKQRVRIRGPPWHQGKSLIFHSHKSCHVQDTTHYLIGKAVHTLRRLKSQCCQVFFIKVSALTGVMLGLGRGYLHRCTREPLRSLTSWIPLNALNLQDWPILC